MGDMDCVDGVDEEETATKGEDEVDCAKIETELSNAFENTKLDVVSTQNELAGAAMAFCCGTSQPEVEPTKQEKQLQRTSQPKATEGCLLRLFESQVFDMSMAISYLFNSKEPGVQSYLGTFEFVFCFSREECSKFGVYNFVSKFCFCTNLHNVFCK